MIMKRMMQMHYELYVDSLFIINLVMNLYILMLVDRSTFRTARPGRLLLGAALGAACYLLMFLLSVPVPLKLLLGGAGAIGMLPVTFPVRGLRNLLKLVEKTLFFSFCMGGALLFLLRHIAVEEGILTGIFGILGAGGIVFLFLRRHHWERNLKEDRCKATLVRGTKKVTVEALIDSGNSLVEPISGKPVSVVEEWVVQELWGEEERLYRAIPYHSIGKAKGILEGYLLPELYVELDGVRKVFRDSYIAVSPEKISASDVPEAESVKMIMNPRLLTEAKSGRPIRGQNERNYDTESGDTGKTAV